MLLDKHSKTMSSKNDYDIKIYYLLVLNIIIRYVLEKVMKIFN
jgi:hypothetical protein